MRTLESLRQIAAELMDGHARLGGEVERLDDLVRNAPDGAARVDVFLTDFLALMQSHFNNENDVMHQMATSRKLKDVFRQHVEAHGDLMGQLASAYGIPSQHQRLEEVRRIIHQWRDEHIPAHDNILEMELGKIC